MRRTVAVVVASLFLVTSVAAVGLPAVGQAETGMPTNGTGSGDYSDRSTAGDPLERTGPAVSENGSDVDLPNQSEWEAESNGLDLPDANGTRVVPNVSNGSGISVGFGDAVANVTNGTDSDGDGLPDAVENATGTDAFDADTDNDGLADGMEVELGTDPTDPDTDDDTLVDGHELAIGASPTDPDTDDDGLDDNRELVRQIDPTAADTDDDGLVDGRELDVGTDPADPDTDGDRLRDGWEVDGETPTGVALPDSDPLARDLYVQVDHVRGVEQPDEAFYAGLGAEFDAMAVRNPDGTTGIDLHVREGGEINESVTFEGDNFWSLKDAYYEERLGPRAGIYHHVLVSEFAPDYAGYGEVGGKYSMVAAGAATDTKRYAVVHELLHNVVGHVDGPGTCHDGKHYCNGGWLSPEITPGEDEYLADPVARQIEDRGFVDG